MSPTASKSRRAPAAGRLTLRALDRAIDDLRSVGGLPLPVEADAIWEGIWYEEAHHSTAIEGNTLVLKEVERLLREGKAVGSKELAEYLEVEGYAKAAQWVYAQAVEQPPDWSVGERINVTELRQIHRLVVEPASLHSPPDALHAREGPGSFRQHDIRPFAGGMTPPPFPEVPALVTDWLRDANRGSAGDESPAGPTRLSAGGHLQARPDAISERVTAGGPGRSGSAR